MTAYLFRDLPAEVAELKDLALDLRWTWSHHADALWNRVDSERWSRTRNPWSILQEVSATRLRELAADPSFLEELRSLSAARKEYLAAQNWFQSTHGEASLRGVAFFCMEFGLSDALPLFAGGLGVLSGDFLKTACDLGIPLVGIGLLYQQGYFRQTIDAQGDQHEVYPYNDPTSLPIQPVTDDDGGWLRVSIELPGRRLVLRLWQALVGRVKLYLLDSNDPLNAPADRGLTARLYETGLEVRFVQEIILGVGGWRALQALAPWIEICHLNEGHAAFLVIERARDFMHKSALSFWEALWATRAGNIFTTHTSVPAGLHRYPLAFFQKYLPFIDDFLAETGIGVDELLPLGRADPADEQEPFNMAYLAMRGSLFAFGVSRLHGRVSREIFQPLFPRWPQSAVPIEHVTNGVHVPSWDSEDADRIWTAACGKERWRCMPDNLSSAIGALSDEAVWALRGTGRNKLVTRVRARLQRQATSRGDVERANRAEHVLDPYVLTLGFARRFAAYKRANLLLTDPPRLARILNHPTRPVQLVVAGKAHPADQEGKDMIREWIAMARKPEFRARLVFLEDYDMTLAEELVQGIDVWLNTPRRPWEACGTSGMKVLVNGGLNLSELDGWWDEAYAPELGWAIGSRSAERSDRDAAEAEELYSTIESSVVPEFYDRDQSGIPRRWLDRIRRSMAMLTPAFSSNRMALEYVERAYMPAAEEYRHRVGNNGKAARATFLWSERLRRGWPGIHIGTPTASTTDDSLSISAPVYLGEIEADDVQVELYAQSGTDGPAEIFELARGDAMSGAANGYIYSGRVATSRPAEDYTIRIVPRRPGVHVPMELPLILWQR